MPLTNTDRLYIERGGVGYYMEAQQLAEFLGVPGDESVADIAARDALSGLQAGVRVFVADASADATVSGSWAVYRWDGTAFTKIQEAESLDVVVSSGGDLGYTAAPAQGTITNTGGADAVVPVVDGTNAGLATPAMFNASHSAATATGTAATNPVTVSGAQGIGFTIANLLALP